MQFFVILIKTNVVTRAKNQLERFVANQIHCFYPFKIFHAQTNSATESTFFELHNQPGS